MSIHTFPRRSLILGFWLLLLLTVAFSLHRAILPSPAINSTLAIAQIIDAPTDIPTPQAMGAQTIVLAGGCFWGTEAVFEQLQGVSNVVSGFSGGSAATANYDTVSGGNTGHAEAIEITYDPNQISFGQLLKIYFFVAHDPTQVNRQSPDNGTQYRSAIFFANPEQQRVSQAYIDKLDRLRIFPHPIATQLVTLTKFYPAEDYHQNFITRNPNYPYVVIHDRPKIARLRQQFPNLVRG